MTDVSVFVLLQQNHAKKQTDRHGEEEVQHGPEKGQASTFKLISNTVAAELQFYDLIENFSEPSIS